MKASETRELGDVARENEIARLHDSAFGLRIALAGMRAEKYQGASELKIGARKAAQLAAVERRLLALRQGRLFKPNPANPAWFQEPVRLEARGGVFRVKLIWRPTLKASLWLVKLTSYLVVE